MPGDIGLFLVGDSGRDRLSLVLVALGDRRLCEEPAPAQRASGGDAIIRMDTQSQTTALDPKWMVSPGAEIKNCTAQGRLPT